MCLNVSNVHVSLWRSHKRVFSSGILIPLESIFFISRKFTIYSTNGAISKYVIRKHLCGAIIQWWFSYIFSCILCIMLCVPLFFFFSLVWRQKMHNVWPRVPNKLSANALRRLRYQIIRFNLTCQTGFSPPPTPQISSSSGHVVISAKFWKTAWDRSRARDDHTHFAQEFNMRVIHRGSKT
jgi:hypothetical protein